MVEDYLCTVDTPCDIHITVDYDKEPISMEVIRPDGTVIKQNAMTRYDIGENTMTAVVQAGQQGDYRLRYNCMANHNIKFDVSQKYMENVLIMDPTTIRGEKTGGLYLKFTLLYMDGSDKTTKIPCSVIMSENPTGMARIVYQDDVNLNQPVIIELNDIGFPEGTYWLDIMTTGEEKGYTAKSRIPLTVTAEEVRMPQETSSAKPKETADDTDAETSDTETQEETADGEG